MTRGPALLLVLLAAAGVRGAEAKRDFRGMEPGMSVAEATAAAAKNGLTCETSFTNRTTCRGGGASVVLVTTGRRSDHIWELQVILAGHYEAVETTAKLVASYGLAATATPMVYDTAAGQQLMLLETGGSQTIFYLFDPAVLRGDAEALPPPKL